jgi:hypothetical protein
MVGITGPKHMDAHPDLELDCEFALGPAFQALLKESVRAGWDEGLASRALIGLAKANLKGMEADIGTDLEALARSTP